MTEEDSSARGETIAGLLCWKRNVLRLDLKESRADFCRRGRGRSFPVEGVQSEFLSERKGKVIPCRRTEDRKVTGTDSGTDSGKSGLRNWRLRVSEAEWRVREGV